MCYFGSDAAFSHTMSHLQQSMIDNTSQIIAYKHWIILICKVAILLVSTLEKPHRLRPNENSHLLQPDHTYSNALYLYTCDNIVIHEMDRRCETRSATEKKFFTLISLMAQRWLPLTACLTLPHINKACAITWNLPATHDTYDFYHVPVSASLVFSYLGLRCCAEFKCSSLCLILSLGPTQTSFL